MGARQGPDSPHWERDSRTKKKQKKGGARGGREGGRLAA